MAFRFDAGQKEALEKIAADNGDLDVSKLIRWAVDALIAHVERNGGRILLPVDLSETFHVVSTDEVELQQPLTKTAEEPSDHKTRRRA